MKKPAPATAALLRKGQQTELLAKPQSLTAKARFKAREKIGTIALTLRIDADRYQQFTQKVAADGTTKQEVLSSLLNDYLGS